MLERLERPNALGGRIRQLRRRMRERSVVGRRKMLEKKRKSERGLRVKVRVLESQGNGWMLMLMRLHEMIGIKSFQRSYQQD